MLPVKNQNKSNGDDFNTLSDILRKITAPNFFGNLQFVFNDGNIVHIDKHETFKPDGIKKVLSK